jgi:hypothetical protein
MNNIEINTINNKANNNIGADVTTSVKEAATLAERTTASVI